MALLNECKVPEDLFYWIEKHVWARLETDGQITLGMTDVAQHMAGNVVTITPKRVGRAIQNGQSVATLESAKWVGPVPAPVSGEISAVNDDVRKSPALLNRDPYGQGWIVRMKPANWETDRAALVTGAEAVEAYQRLLDAEGIRCGEAGTRKDSGP